MKEMKKMIKPVKSILSIIAILISISLIIASLALYSNHQKKDIELYSLKREELIKEQHQLLAMIDASNKTLKYEQQRNKKVTEQFASISNETKPVIHINDTLPQQPVPVQPTPQSIPKPRVTRAS